MLGNVAVRAFRHDWFPVCKNVHAWAGFAKTQGSGLGNRQLDQEGDWPVIGRQPEMEPKPGKAVGTSGRRAVLAVLAGTASGLIRIRDIAHRAFGVADSPT
jgi:hypothetical protein